MNAMVSDPLGSDAAEATCWVSNKTGNPPRPAGNPAPVAVTLVPTGPWVRERTVLGSTVKVAVAALIWHKQAGQTVMPLMMPLPRLNKNSLNNKKYNGINNKKALVFFRAPFLFNEPSLMLGLCGGHDGE